MEECRKCRISAIITKNTDQNHESVNYLSRIEVDENNLQCLCLSHNDAL